MENITIPLEEYKELLSIKGRYEELKDQVEKQNKQMIYRKFDIR